MNQRPPLRRSAPIQEENDGIIEGRNAVIEALRAGVAMDKIYIARGETDATLGHIAAAAREKGVVVVDADRRKLDGMSRTHAHQGVIALAAVREYTSVEDILAAARGEGGAPLIVVCDELSDPPQPGRRHPHRRVRRGPRRHHSQAPLRRPDRRGGQDQRRRGGPPARGPGAQPARPAAPAQGAGGCGSSAPPPTAPPPSIRPTLKGPAAIVIGSEGDGMGRLVSEQCDFLVSIPMRGKLNSLNASAAAAILLYEAVRQRSPGA